MKKESARIWLFSTRSVTGDGAVLAVLLNISSKTWHRTTSQTLITLPWQNLLLCYNSLRFVPYFLFGFLFWPADRYFFPPLMPSSHYSVWFQEGSLIAEEVFLICKEWKEWTTCSLCPASAWAM